MDVGPPTLGINGVEPPTPCVEGPATVCLKAGRPTQVGHCEQNCVNMLGNYNSEFTLIAIVLVSFDGFLQESSVIWLSLIQLLTFLRWPLTLKSSSVSGSRSGRDWLSLQG